MQQAVFHNVGAVSMSNRTFRSQHASDYAIVNRSLRVVISFAPLFLY